MLNSRYEKVTNRDFTVAIKPVKRIKAEDTDLIRFEDSDDWPLWTCLTPAMS